MKAGKTKFIVTLPKNKIPHIDKIAQTLKDDGVKVEQVSSMFGIISGNAKSTLQELKQKYEPKGLTIEPDREVSI